MTTPRPKDRQEIDPDSKPGRFNSDAQGRHGISAWISLISLTIHSPGLLQILQATSSMLPV
jgi:hypothetical protein